MLVWIVRKWGSLGQDLLEMEKQRTLPSSQGLSMLMVDHQSKILALVPAAVRVANLSLASGSSQQPGQLACNMRIETPASATFAADIVGHHLHSQRNG